MRIGTRSIVLITLCAALPAGACEPIVPFIKAVGGPGFLTVAFLILLAVIAIKSVAFARFQATIGLPKALAWMFVANVVTSIIGITIPVMIDSGALMFIGLPVVWAACLPPAQRLIAAAPLSPLAHFSSGQLAFGMTLALAFSCLLLVISRTVHDAGTFMSFWFLKLPAVYLALLIGLVLTALWEEWIVWRLSGAEDDDLTFVRPVIRANVIVLAVVLLISMAIIVPRRLREPLSAQAATRQSVPAATKTPAR